MTIIRADDPIRVLMSTPVAFVEPTVSLADLATRLETEGVGAVAVMSGDHLDGVVSERDIIRALAAKGDPSDVWAADVMTEDPVFVDLEEPIVRAVERMLDEGVRHMLVMNGGEVVGVVSARDALRVLADDWWRTRAGQIET